MCLHLVQFSSVTQSFQLFVTPWTCQAFLSITNSWSLLKLMSIESVMPSNHLILCRPLLFPPSIFPSIRVFSSEVAQRIKRLPAMQDTRVRSLDWEDPLEKEMATHSSILAWRIPWTEEPGGLQSMGSQRFRHD